MAAEGELKQGLGHAPDWVAGAVAGFAAGAILMVLDLVWSFAVTDQGPWGTSRMIAAMVLGPQTLQSSEFNWGVVGGALIAHYTLGVVFGLILAAVSAPWRLDRTLGIALVSGAIFGAVLYIVNFNGLVYFFPWFAQIRGWPALVAHLIFGASAATLYWKLERR